MPKAPNLEHALLASAQPPPRATAVTSRHQRPSRLGTHTIAGHFAPDVRRQLRTLAAARDSTVQQLLAEALNDLFAKYHKPEIA